MTAEYQVQKAGLTGQNWTMVAVALKPRLVTSSSDS